MVRGSVLCMAAFCSRWKMMVGGGWCTDTKKKGMGVVHEKK